MEARHWVAYGLIALIVVGGGAALTVLTNKRRARRRRMRGIKDDQTPSSPRTTLSSRA